LNSPFYFLWGGPKIVGFLSIVEITKLLVWPPLSAMKFFSKNIFLVSCSFGFNSAEAYDALVNYALVYESVGQFNKHYLSGQF
jgi:hypothetical protein